MWMDKYSQYLDWTKIKDITVFRLKGVHWKYKDTERMKLKDAEKAIPCKC